LERAEVARQELTNLIQRKERLTQEEQAWVTAAAQKAIPHDDEVSRLVAMQFARKFNQNKMTMDKGSPFASLLIDMARLHTDRNAEISEDNIRELASFKALKLSENMEELFIRNLMDARIKTAIDGLNNPETDELINKMQEICGRAELAQPVRQQEEEE
jgi:hypothetical protein